MIFYIITNGIYYTYSLTYFTVSSIFNLVMYIRRSNRLKRIENKIDENELKLYNLQFQLDDISGKDHGYEIVDFKK